MSKTVVKLYQGQGLGPGQGTTEVKDVTSNITLPFSDNTLLISHLTVKMASRSKWDQPAVVEEQTLAKVPKTDEGRTASEAAAAAAAIAAKIAAQFANGELSAGGLPKDPHDADFTHNIDINDVRNRYLLTRGSTQDQARSLFVLSNEAKIVADS